MSHKNTEEEARHFYARWGPSVITFCRLFLDDEEKAEQTTQDAFVAYIRGGFSLELNGVPIQLLKAALAASKEHCSHRALPRFDARELEDVLPLLPCEQRAVFILRSVLDLQVPWVAAVTSMTAEQVNALWMQALLHVRRLMFGKAA